MEAGSQSAWAILKVWGKIATSEVATGESHEYLYWQRQEWVRQEGLENQAGMRKDNGLASRDALAWFAIISL
jgi:hypothetical protein